MHLLIAATLLAAPLAQDAAPVKVGGTVPEFTVTDTAGKAWTLAELRKRTSSDVVSLTFWCTFCHSCRMMDAKFQTLADDFRGKAAVVGLDASALDTPGKIDAFARDRKFTVPVFIDPGKAADLFGVTKTTTTLVIDKDGVLRYRGRFDGAAAALKAVLAGEDVKVKETDAAG